MALSVKIKFWEDIEYILFCVYFGDFQVNGSNCEFDHIAGKPSFTKKQADLFFPPDFNDDFPVAMQVLNSSMFVINRVTCGNFVNVEFVYLADVSQVQLNLRNYKAWATICV